MDTSTMDFVESRFFSISFVYEESNRGLIIIQKKLYARFWFCFRKTGDSCCIMYAQNHICII